MANPDARDGDISDAQKSEVHRTTADADSYPVDEPIPHSKPHPNAPHTDGEKRPLGPLPFDTEIVRDDTSDGGPLFIKSGDPDLDHSRTPQDPFPTERKPEIDPPVERK